MPFRSQSQARWMWAAAKRGDIPKDMPKRWAHETKDIKSLPQRVTMKEYARKKLRDAS